MYPDPFDPTYKFRLEASGLKTRIGQLEHAAKTCEKKHTLDALFNAMCACEARVAAIVLSDYLPAE